MKILSFLILTAMFLACGSAPETRYFSVYYDVPMVSAKAGSKVLFVQKLTANPLLRTDKMIYKPSKYEYKFDYYRRWVEEPADMLTFLLVRHLRARGTFKDVTLAPLRSQAFYMLTGQLRRFEETFENGKHLARISLAIKVQDMKTQDMLFDDTLDSYSEISRPGEEGILDAMSEATKSLLDDLTEKLEVLEKE
jgi:ABC-type uncharacterized transport system auxiliary subunit